MFSRMVGGIIDCGICCWFLEDVNFYLGGCRVMSRSRKLKLLLCSKVGVNCRLGCILFMWLCIISGVVCFVLYISSMSSTYLV